ncbi:unnamed protein product [Echinostoma caproni]|uniref:Ion_trans_N domain-containing protein n=1 Tax=Echinostoma caproni TaxID=27848 RepID=A0A183A4Y4_9TREM|nr:unnamed protein product [Echinostoma caproni]
MEGTKTVTFDSPDIEETQPLKRNFSSDNLSPRFGPKNPTSSQMGHDFQDSPSSPHGIRTNNSLGTSRPGENDHSTDKSTSTNNFNLNSHSTYSIAALADGNFVEQGSEMAKQSTSSYLKEQFLAFFQPSDNKLAMKLFGSKNALLKEKRRQAQQGKWIIHPCSSFR